MATTSAALLSRFVKKNDPKAFGEIIHLHSGLVYGACIRVLGDEHKAADATQETFFQLMKHAAEISTSLPGWLHRVATRQAIDRLKKDSRRRQRENDYASEPPRETEHWADVSPYVDEELDRLDEATRTVVIQHFLEGRSTREIGRELGISQATVSRRLQAGVNVLRGRLRSRGLLVATAALGGWLLQGTAQAAPAVVLQELGKMAIVGSAAAAGGMGAAGTTAAGKAATGGLMAGVGAKVATAAAVTVVGVGSVVTYHHVRHEDAPPPTVMVQEQETVARPVRQDATGPEIRIIPAADPPAVRVLANAPAELEPQPQAAEMAMTDDEREFEEWLASLEEPVAAPVESAPAAGGGETQPIGGMGGGMMGMGGYAEEGAGFGGGMMMGGIGGVEIGPDGQVILTPDGQPIPIVPPPPDDPEGY